jgi:hypothetical protein
MVKEDGINERSEARLLKWVICVANFKANAVPFNRC